MFSAVRADYAVEYFERVLRHTKGRWADQPFRLADWQVEQVIRPLFGELRDDRLRRYRYCFVGVPRKQGKSTLGAGLATLLLCADGEHGAEVYSAAADRRQASIVFEQAREMVLGSPDLSRRLTCYRHSILDPPSRSSYRVLSSDAPLAHGLNAHGVIFDELHTQRGRHLWDALTTSQGSREQPIVLAITTAGYDRHSICWEVWQHAVAVLEERVEDDAFLPVIYAAESSADWLSEETWRRANPSLGVTISIEYLREEAERARHLPGRQNAFRQLHLDQWTEQAERWIDLAAWDACAGEFSWRELREPHRWRGRVAYAGLDLAQTRDLSALVLYITSDDGPAWLVPYLWVDEETLRVRVQRDRAPYDVWQDQGILETTPGNVCDLDYIEQRIRELWDLPDLDLREIAYDRTFAGQLVQHLIAGGIVMIPHGQDHGAMAAPTSELERQILGGLDSPPSPGFVHGGHPALRWMAGNAAIRRDAQGRIRLDKERATERIDGMTAAAMAISRAMLRTPEATVGLTAI